MAKTSAAKDGRPRVLLANFTTKGDNIEHFNILDLVLGYRVEVRGQNGVAAATGPYELIVQMGLGDDKNNEREEGLKFLRKLREKFPTVPILVVSEHPETYGRALVLAQGADDFLYRKGQDEPAQFVYHVNALIGSIHQTKTPR